MDSMESYLKISYEILHYLNSDLELDVKLDNIDVLIEERGNIIKNMDGNETVKSEENYQKIVDVDSKIADKISIMMKERASKISEIISERVLTGKQKKVNKMYMDYNTDSGYFINAKK